jgi:hypothetical protein
MTRGFSIVPCSEAHISTVLVAISRSSSSNCKIVLYFRPHGARDDSATRRVWSCGGNAVRDCIDWRKGRMVLQVFGGRVAA